MARRQAANATFVIYIFKNKFLLFNYFYGPCMSYTTGSSAARPPLTAHPFRHVGHSSRFPAPLAGSGLPTIRAQ